MLRLLRLLTVLVLVVSTSTAAHADPPDAPAVNVTTGVRRDGTPYVQATAGGSNANIRFPDANTIRFGGIEVEGSGRGVGTSLFRAMFDTPQARAATRGQTVFSGDNHAGMMAAVEHITRNHPDRSLQGLTMSDLTRRQNEPAVRAIIRQALTEVNPSTGRGFVPSSQMWRRVGFEPDSIRIVASNEMFEVTYRRTPPATPAACATPRSPTAPGATPAAANAGNNTRAAPTPVVARTPPMRSVRSDVARSFAELGPAGSNATAPLTSQAQATLVFAAAVLAAARVVDNDRQMRTIAVLGRNMREFRQDYQAWLYSDASGVGSRVAPVAGRSPASIDVHIAQIGSQYIAHFNTAEQIRAAQRDPLAFQSMAFDAFDRYHTSRFLNETGWQPPWSMVQHTANRTWSDVLWGERFRTTFNDLVRRDRDGTERVFVNTGGRNGRLTFSETGMTMDRYRQLMTDTNNSFSRDSRFNTRLNGAPPPGLPWRDLPPIPLTAEDDPEDAVDAADEAVRQAIARRPR